MTLSPMQFTLMKTATYCVMHFCVAIAVAYALTRNWTAALAIGIIEPFVQTFFFAIHDRFWARYDGRGACNPNSNPCGTEVHGGVEPVSLASIGGHSARWRSGS